LAQAVAAFQAALNEYTREETPEEWAMTQNNLGSALVAQAERNEGPQAGRLLSEAVAAFREGLKVVSGKSLMWAVFQNNLGKALGVQADGARVRKQDGC